MRLLTITSLALACSAAVATAQPAPEYPNPDGYQAAPADTTDNPNVQSYQAYQSAISAYDAARDAAAQDAEDFQSKTLQYRADQRAYHHQLHAYERARADYDAEYGPGAYEAYYSPPAPPPY